jgi:hypothetical protein
MRPFANGIELPCSSASAQIIVGKRTPALEKRPCFQFAPLLRSRPSGVRGPVLLPP